MSNMIHFELLRITNILGYIHNLRCNCSVILFTIIISINISKPQLNCQCLQCICFYRSSQRYYIFCICLLHSPVYRRFLNFNAICFNGLHHYAFLTRLSIRYYSKIHGLYSYILASYRQIKINQSRLICYYLTIFVK